MENQRGKVKLPQVFSEVRLGERFDGFVCAQSASLHAPEPELIQDALRHFRAWPVGSIKLYCEVLVKLRPIAGNPGANVVEDLDWQAFRVGLSLQHDWRNSGNQNRRRDPLAAVTTNVAR